MKRHIKKITYIFFLFGFCFLRAQELSVNSEIVDNYLPKNYFKLKNGIPIKILVLDTIYGDNKKEVEMIVYRFKGTNQFSTKKYKNGGLTAYRTMEIDSIGRSINYTDSLSSGSVSTKDEIKNFITRLKYTYKENLKIAERINASGEAYSRNIVYYDSLKNPKIITETVVGPNVTKLQTIDYDYANGTFVHKDYGYIGNEVKENNGYINLDYIIDKNKEGDITKMYWIMSKKKDSVVHEIDYTYDKHGNWTKKIKTLAKPGEPKKILSKTYRKIKYSN